VRRLRAAQFEAALCAVERWPLDTATDLTDAGYGCWSELHAPRQPLHPDAVLRILDEIEADLGLPIGPVH